MNKRTVHELLRRSLQVEPGRAYLLLDLTIALPALAEVARWLLQALRDLLAAGEQAAFEKQLLTFMRSVRDVTDALREIRLIREPDDLIELTSRSRAPLLFDLADELVRGTKRVFDIFGADIFQRFDGFSCSVDRPQLEVVTNEIEQLVARLQSASSALTLRTDAGSPQPTPPKADWYFFETGNTYRLGGCGCSGTFKASKGLGYLHALLNSPKGRIGLLDLVAVGAPTSDAAGADATGQDLLLDKKAMAAYRERVAQLGDEIEDARRAGSERREEIATRERDEIAGILRSAKGLGGRIRSFADPLARLRAAVNAALNRAYDKMKGSGCAELASHFKSAIRTEHGELVYGAHPRPAWQFSEK